MSDHPPLAVIAGPTASGKSALALALAERHGLEIVSADSRQIYRGLDIGTAKPTPEERARVPHHLIDICDPAETHDVARYAREAEAAIEAIHARGRRPLVVGGTGLYIRGLTQGLFEEGARDDAVRARLSERAERGGSPALHAELQRLDPEAAERIHPNDAVRVVRALEVREVSGVPISEHWRRSRETGPRHARCLAVLDWPTAALDRRIGERVDAMLATGLLEEVESLLASGVDPAAPGMQAIGYPQAVRAVRGESTREAAREEIALQTRRYAKRQRTWFRSERGAEWLSVDDASDAENLAALEKRLALV